MASGLTPEQKARIEENRKHALEKRASRLLQISHSKPNLQNDCLTKVALKGLQTKETGRSNNGASSSSFAQSNSTIGNSGSASNVYSNTSLPAGNSSNFQSNANSSKKTDSNNYSSLNINFFKSKKSEDQQTVPNCFKTTTSGKPSTPITGVSRLIAKDRFTIDIPYHQQAIELFRTVNGKEYDSKTRLWTFPVKEYFNCKKIISVLKPHVLVGDLPKCVIETFITRAREFQLDNSNVDISRINEKLRQTIYPFQKEGIQYGISKKGRCLVADDMGLGKSIQALGIADYYRSDWPLLIVCPSSMRFQWEEEIRVQLPNSVHTHQVFVMNSGKDIVDGAKVLILSYDLLVKKKELIKEMRFGVIIMDESHCIKSMKTQRGQAALEISELCKRVILLSGTPVLSRPAELYTQIRAVDKTAFPYFKDYGIRYCDGNQTKFGWNFSGSSNMEELKLLLETRFMIRRLKCNVLTQLPSKIRQVIVLKSPSLKKSNESMEAFALKLQSTTLKGMERHGTLLSYFSETAKIKSAAACEYITDLLLQDNRKLLCFAHHAQMLDAISETLEKNKTHYIRIDGATSAEDRKMLCDKFQFEDKWMVAVLSIRAANTGLTLTAAQVVVFAELFWNPGDLVQAEDRAHRIGQEDCVVVKYLIAKGTADDYLWPLIQTKLDILNKAGLSKENNMAAGTTVLNIPDLKKETQTKLDDYFSDPFGDEDNEDLLKVMDEIDGVQEKKIKLDS